ncbi:MAG: (d)CMP kinase [Oscillospiraceae bacterium]
MKMINIAIDGPSGAGKSTLARMTAQKLGYIYVDTGALYRCVGLYALKKPVDLHDAAAVAALLPEIDIEMKHEDGLQRMYLNGADVTDDIRLPEVSLAASAVSAIPQVRGFLLDTQRDMAYKYDVIMDGRDIGTVVLPDADIKIFLTASAEERAKRRHTELVQKGMTVSFDDVLRDIEKRDRDDSSRDIAPLRKADDAVELDTTALSLEESFDRIKRLVEERVGHGF